ncbi:MAG: RNA-binding protein, partial [Oscillospiraceae bacterium]|nr:RNA-binding protein [Oscillospiraceae bacterium]
TASLRLDAVAGFALNVSRGKISGIIKGIGAEVNSSLKNDCSYILSEGDVFSVRGYGKYRLSQVSGMTKKGRIHITVLKYC